MQTLFVCLLLVAGTFALNSFQHDVNEEGPRCPIPDPLDEPRSANISLVMHPLFNLDEGTTRENLHVSGLSTLWYNLTVEVLTFIYHFEIKIDTLNLTSTYKASGYLDGYPFREETLPSGNFSGEGTIHLEASGVHILGHGNLLVNVINNTVSYRNLTLDILKFDSLSLDLGENFVIGGKTIDWAAWSRDIKENFDQDWVEHRAEMTEKARLAINSYWKERPLEMETPVIPIEPAPCPETT